MSNNLWKRLGSVLDFNSSDLSGTLDVIIVEDQNHIKNSTAFHFRIGKFKVFRPDQREVNIYVNGQLSKTSMKLSQRGIGYFEVETDAMEMNNSQFSNIIQSDVDLIDDIRNPEVSEPKKDRLIKMHKSRLDVQSHELRDIEMDQLILEDKPKPNNYAINSNHKDPSSQLDITSAPNNNFADVQPQDSNMNYEKKNDTPGTSYEDKQIELSLCAHLIKIDMDPHIINEIFNRHNVSFSTFCKSPHLILNHKNLVIRVENKIYEGNVALPQILSVLAFNKELSPNTLTNLAKEITKKHAYINLQYLPSKKKIMRRSLKPSQFILDTLGLKEGVNELVYKVKGNMGKMYTFYSRIFYYSYRPQFRVIISDIDGTVTKSDVFGHLMPFVNQEWTHTGIAELHSNFYNRGYIIIYLSSRNIGLAEKTMNYLRSVKQRKYKLPDGPIITSPDTLYESFKREIIIKNPEVFKIHVLRDIKGLFGNGKYNPLFAGFGNKDSDAISYRVVSIPRHYIFTLTPSGDIYMIKSKKIFSYPKINKMLDELFPCFNANEDITFELQDERHVNDKHMLSNLSDEQIEKLIVKQT